MRLRKRLRALRNVLGNWVEVLAPTNAPATEAAPDGVCLLLKADANIPIDSIRAVLTVALASICRLMPLIAALAPPVAQAECARPACVRR